MRFFLFVTFVTYAMVGIVQLVSATPVVSTKDMVVKRDNADIIGVFNKLKGSLAGPLSEIDNLVTTQTANQSNIEPLINEITAALDTAANELAALKPSSILKRQSDDEVAQLIAATTTLNGLLGSAATIPLLGGLLAGVDTSLNQVLIGLSIILQGVLRLVANLLSNVAQLLRSLTLGLSFGTLGL